MDKMAIRDTLPTIIMIVVISCIVYIVSGVLTKLSPEQQYNTTLDESGIVVKDNLETISVLLDWIPVLMGSGVCLIILGSIFSFFKRRVEENEDDEDDDEDESIHSSKLSIEEAQLIYNKEQDELNEREVQKCAKERPKQKKVEEIDFDYDKVLEDKKLLDL